MEGNLNRARSTIGPRPSSSMSSFTNARGGEPTSLYSLPNNRINQNGHAHAKHRQTSSLDDSKPSHSRGFSDASPTNGGADNEGLGIINVEKADPGRQWFWNGLTRTTSLANRHPNNGLQPLHEDGPAPQSFKRQAIQEEQDDDAAADQGFDDLQNASSSNFATFESENPPATGLTRARSTTQMRDIRDQMQDLKGKISNLKQRARQDSLYRRSLQNLRTPSPFTAAEQWYNGVPTHAERTSSVSPNPNGTPNGATPRTGSTERKVQPEATEEIITNGHFPKTDELEKDNDSGVDVQEEERNRPETAQTVLTAIPRNVETTPEPKGVREITPEALAKPLPDSPPAVEETPSVTGDSLYAGDNDSDQAFHETSTLPLGERHEDRPDAFDYENFFLHSGMGHHKTGRSRSNSNSSIYSVETTKPADSTEDTPKAAKTNGTSHSKRTKEHVRKDSIDSTASFATAIEEKAASDPEVSTPKNTVIAPPRSDSLKHRKVNGANSHKTRDPKRERVSSGKKKTHTNGTRPPSNSLSSTPVNSHSAAHIYAPDVPTAAGASSAPPAKALPNGTSTTPPPLLDYLSALTSDPAATKGIRLGDRDSELTDRLMSSLAKVCRDLDAIDPAEEGEAKYRARMYRRKLDAARRVLDGEVNGEAF